MSSQPFFPTMIPGCILWFDPSDTTTVTTSGNQVLQLTNKGTLNTVASNVRAAGVIGGPWSMWPPPGSTTIGTNVFNTSPLSTIRFTRTVGGPGGEFGNAYNGSYLTVNNVTTTSKSRTLFAVIGFTTGGIDNYFRLFATTTLTNNGTNSNYSGFFDVGSPGFTRFPISYSGEEFSFGNTAPFSAPLNTSGNPFIFASRHTTLAASNYGSVNGINQNFYQNNALNNGYATGTDQMAIGIGAAYTREFYLGELVYFDGMISDLQMRQMEGYLAWKWGNQAGLPSTHPYKNGPPTGTSIFGQTQANLINTFATPGTLTLPTTFSMPGRMLTFKDSTGAFSTNALTLSTNGANQSLDAGLQRLLVNTRSGWISLIANTNNRWMTIGGTVLNTINASTINTLQISTPQISTGNILTSTLAIRDQSFGSTNNLYTSSSLLFYNNGVTNTIIAGTRQSFGGNFVATTLPFSPTQITGLTLWFDGADINTLQQNAGSISRWLDKSGNNRFATGFNNPRQTRWITNGIPCISLNTNQYFAGSYAGFLTTTTLTAFVVAFTNVSLPRAVADQRLVSFATNNTTPDYNNNSSAIIFFNQGGSSSISTYRNGGFVAANNIVQNVPFLLCSLYNGTNGFMFFNGSAATTTGTATSGSFNVGAFGIGNAANITTEFWNGSIAEIIIYNTALTPQQRQHTEGYLAWKWGLAQNLPADHPYRNFPPTAFLIFGVPYFVSIVGGASLVFTYDFNLASGTTNTATDIFIYTTGQSLVANTSASVAPAFSFTTDGTTNGTTGKLTANLTFNTNYIARVRINISPSPGQVFSAYSIQFLYGAAPTAAPTLGAYSGGATMSIAWTSPTATNSQPISGSNIAFAIDSAANTLVAQAIAYNGGSPFTTNGTTNFTSGALVFNTPYWAVVQMSNAIGTTRAISASSQVFGSGSLAPTIGTLTGGTTLDITWTNNTSLAQPTQNNQVFIYSNSIGTTLVTTSVPLSAGSSFTTNGTSASGNLNANLTFNTTYYARVGSSNALNSSWTNSSGVTAGALYGAAPQEGLITNYAGGATMTATLSSFPTNAQPVTSSNVSFMVGLTVVANRSGYTGGSSYSTTGVAGDFTSGSLTFGTFYVLRLQLVNALGTTETYSDYDVRFGDVPADNPSGITYTAATYYGTSISMTWTAPGAGSLARPVSSVTILYRDSGTLVQQVGNGYSITNSQTSLSGINTGVYGLSLNIGLASINALGSGTAVWGSAVIIQYQFSMGDLYSRIGGGNQTYLTTSRSQTRIQYSGSGITSGNGWYTNVQIVDGSTRTLTWQRTTSGLSSNTLSVNGTSVGNGTSGTVSVTNGAVVRFQWGGTSAHSYTITLTLS